MNGKTQLVGILGWPVSHSKSPAMHNAAFKHLNLNWKYVLLPVSPTSSLQNAIRELAETGFRGANITVPYKEETLTLVDEISEEAKAIGALNTLVLKPDGVVRGENTDAPGFLAHLYEENVNLNGQTVAVIGAGGAARAMVYALLEGGVKNVLVINRSKSKADALAASSPLIKSLDWSRTSFEQASLGSIIVNTTSLGLTDGDPLPWHEQLAFRPSQVVYDAIYSNTPFLQKAKHDGARAISGAGMLLWQGALAFEMWTGVKAPIDVMRRELQNA